MRRTPCRVGDLVEIHTDGACRGNPGPGGWGAILSFRGREKELFGAERETTNNQMELMAAIRGLEALNRASRVRLTTDSQYVRNGATRWLDLWKRNGWKNAARQPVKNAQLWRRLDAAASSHEIDWVWTRGHSGDAGNERADALARKAIDVMLSRGRS